MQLNQLRIGGFTLSTTNPGNNVNAPFDQPVNATFSTGLDQPSVQSSIQLKQKNGTPVSLTFAFLDSDRTFSATPSSPLLFNTEYDLVISNTLKGAQEETFPGVTVSFTTAAGTLTITSLKFNDVESLAKSPIINISRTASVSLRFSNPIDPSKANASYLRVLGPGSLIAVNYSLSDNNRVVTMTASEPLAHLSRHQIWVSHEMTGAGGEVFSQFLKYFYTEVDPTPKFPVISDEALLTLVQQQTFKYFWDFAHPASGMARERNTSGNLVTTGGSGFGIMSIIVGIERGFISRAEGMERMNKILTFLETADRFHGVWPHWLDGNTGKVIPFSTNDNGADLVETAFLVQGLIAFRQYLDGAVPTENSLINRINALWHAVEWDWYRRGNQNTLYWHWSPDKGWAMNLQIKGWNEALIIYLLAASSPTHSVPKIVYDNGWASNGGMKNGNTYEGIVLPLGPPSGGPLFFAHYSFLGLDPHGLSDAYCSDYFLQNRNHSLINQAYCIRNPKNFVGYSDENWGLTASDNHTGYSAHSPTNDLGVITPTAALSSFPYTPEESMKALKFFYYTLGDRLWGTYGFYDAFNVTAGWTANSYLAIDQGPIIVMIENHRTGLLWDLFMSAPEVQSGMVTLGLTN
ncbi:MAG: Ig-like domain-containing protein [Cyclobacteriaceae bacterium]|nr:Ig-like domain-containing protein [Cyclobacteriaceae bacterium]UYN86042.1 MAG: Ig-like domain-containing protein [Cyclobacteriaceae bacterium]